MGKRINPAAIGGFIVGAVLLIIVGILLFGRLQLLTEKGSFVLYFEGSVKGLDVGAPVDFQGVRIGSVTDVRVQYFVKDGEFRIPVFIDIEPGRVKEVGVRDTQEAQQQFLKFLIDRGLRAQLGMQSLVTGQLFVQLDFHPGTPVRLVGGAPAVPELPTIPTPLQQASQAAQEMLEKLQQLPLDQLFANVLEITQGLNRLVNAPELPDLLRSTADAATTAQQLAQRVDGQITRLLDDAGGATNAARLLMTDVQQLVRNVNGRVGPLADGAKETIEVARATLKDGQQLVRQLDGRIGRLTDGLGDTTKAAQTTLVRTQRTLDGDLSHALQEMTAAMRAIRLLADYLERNPNALVYGKGGERR
jgi:phospholipid/cholesterol/gamma-HCH transport system substrate-binding protein